MRNYIINIGVWELVIFNKYRGLGTGNLHFLLMEYPPPAPLALTEPHVTVQEHSLGAKDTT